MSSHHVNSNSCNDANKIAVVGDSTNDECGGVGNIPTVPHQNVQLSQFLSSTQDQHSTGNAPDGEKLAPDPPLPSVDSPKAKFNNAQQARHWNFTFNNYTETDYIRIKQILESDISKENPKHVTCIVAREVGETGTPHLQSYIHFKKPQRQQAVFKFLGYLTPCFHLQHQDLRRKPPIASFKYCMKDGDFYVTGKNLDEISKKKKQTKHASAPDYDEMQKLIESREITTMRQVRTQGPELAARHEDYWKGLIVQHMPKTTIVIHKLRPWQIDLIEKLKEPFSDREVIFVIDEKGKAGKSWFCKYYDREHGKCIQVGADKRETLAYDVLNKIIEDGTPNVIFMDAPRARSCYVAMSWLEETKNCEIKSAKYRSKSAPLSHPPHVVVMMNAYPKKQNNDEGLSDDRYTYFIIDDTGENGKWVHGFIDPNQSKEHVPYMFKRTPPLTCLTARTDQIISSIPGGSRPVRAQSSHFPDAWNHLESTASEYHETSNDTEQELP